MSMGNCQSKLLVPQECWEQWSRRDGHLPQVWGVKEGFPEEAVPGLCSLQLHWKDCPLLGRDSESRQPRKAKSVAQGKESGDYLYPLGRKEGRGTRLPLLCHDPVMFRDKRYLWFTPCSISLDIRWARFRPSRSTFPRKA